MAKSFNEWFQGPWRATAAGALQDRTRLAPGEIMPHPNGNVVILNCPACNAMQFTAAKLQGSPTAPTLSKAVQCGAGFCHRCGVWFTVVGGVTKEAAKPPVPPTRIPESLRKAGVKHPPSIEVEVRKVKQKREG